MSHNQTPPYAKIDIFFPVAITAEAQSATNVIQELNPHTLPPKLRKFFGKDVILAHEEPRLGDISSSYVLA